MTKSAFLRLHETLRTRGYIHSSRNVRSEEQLLMFLAVAGSSFSVRWVCETFHHSEETVSRHFRNVLSGLEDFSREMITLDLIDVDFLERQDDSRFWSFFGGAVGAGDCCHIKAHVPIAEQRAYRNRKGELSQNVFAVRRFHWQIRVPSGGLGGQCKGQP